MDEERLAILEILERQAAAKAAPQTVRRSASPMTSPRSPIRSMLDVGPESSPTRKGTPPPVKYRSLLDIGPAPPKTQPPVRSMLGPDTAAPPSPGYPPSVRSSISEATNATGSSGGTASGTSPRPTSETPRYPDSSSRRHVSPHRTNLADYQFSDIITSQIGQSLPMPKRNQQGGRTLTSPLAQVTSHPQPVLPQGHEPLRHSISGPIPRRGNQSRSPHSQRSVRGPSPPAALLPEKPKSKVAMLDSGYEVDLSKAYKNLSDASLLASHGPLAHLALQKASQQEDGEGPLIKAYVGPDGERLDDSSSDETHTDADDEEDHRGRNTAPRIVYGSEELMPSDPTREPKSLLAAAEEERKLWSSRSLFLFTWYPDQSNIY